MGLLFTSALVLGIAFAAPPGAVTTEAVRRGLARGFRPALLVGLGSLVGDAVWAVMALTGAAFLVQVGPARLLLGLMGAGALLVLAFRALGEARAGRLPAAAGPRARADFGAGVILSLGNPFAIAFWLGVGGTTVLASVDNPTRVHFALFFGAFMLGSTLWALFLAGLIAWGHRLLDGGFFRWVNLACGLFLGFFGLTLLWRTLQLALS